MREGGGRKGSTRERGGGRREERGMINSCMYKLQHTPPCTMNWKWKMDNRIIDTMRIHMRRSTCTAILLPRVTLYRAAPTCTERARLETNFVKLS